VSAFCCTRSVLLVQNTGSNSRVPSITARPTTDEKRRFAKLAASSRHLGICTSPDRNTRSIEVERSANRYSPRTPQPRAGDRSNHDSTPPRRPPRPQPPSLTARHSILDVPRRSRPRPHRRQPTADHRRAIHTQGRRHHPGPAWSRSVSHYPMPRARRPFAR
jgi:hypothetical protein